jgi:hypothetical protein
MGPSLAIASATDPWPAAVKVMATAAVECVLQQAASTRVCSGSSNNGNTQLTKVDTYYS